jgi:capsule polysaccharide export protein KpsC/LpsZ
MIEAVLKHDVLRQVMVTLHPEETYSAEEKNAPEALMGKHDRLFMQVGEVNRYLKTCDYVVTQISSAGFMGYFFGKPLILFAKSYMHHIALNVERMNQKRAFEAVADHKPDYAGYLHRSLQQRGQTRSQDRNPRCLAPSRLACLNEKGRHKRVPFSLIVSDRFRSNLRSSLESLP